MNPAGKKHYGDMTGKSLFECHDEHSQAVIKDILSRLQAGAEEIMYKDTGKKRICMRAVRDNSGRVLGYYERFAAPARK